MRTGDRIILQNLRANRLRVDFETGDIYGVSGRKLRGTLHNGYHCVSLRDLESTEKGVRALRKVYVHRVVWLAKRGKRGADKPVTHIQPPDTDNRLENLARGRKKQRAYKMLTPRQRAAIRRSTRATQKAIARKYGVTQSAVHFIQKAA